QHPASGADSQRVTRNRLDGNPAARQLAQMQGAQVPAEVGSLGCGDDFADVVRIQCFRDHSRAKTEPNSARTKTATSGSRFSSRLFRDDQRAPGPSAGAENLGSSAQLPLAYASQSAPKMFRSFRSSYSTAGG